MHECMIDLWLQNIYVGSEDVKCIHCIMLCYFNTVSNTAEQTSATLTPSVTTSIMLDTTLAGKYHIITRQMFNIRGRA